MTNLGDLLGCPGEEEEEEEVGQGTDSDVEGLQRPI